jgi:hypothetical protein
VTKEEAFEARVRELHTQMSNMSKIQSQWFMARVVVRLEELERTAARKTGPKSKEA